MGLLSSYEPNFDVGGLGQKAPKSGSS